MQCPAKNVKGIPCTPLNSDGTAGTTVYSKCECGNQYSETCSGNGQVPGSGEDVCENIDEDGNKIAKYKSCGCSEEYNKDCAETGAIPSDSSQICKEVKYIGSQKVVTEKFKSCGCGEQYKYKCDGTDAGDDATNASKYSTGGGVQHPWTGKKPPAIWLVSAAANIRSPARRHGLSKGRTPALLLMPTDRELQNMFPDLVLNRNANPKTVLMPQSAISI